MFPRLLILKDHLEFVHSNSFIHSSIQTGKNDSPSPSSYNPAEGVYSSYTSSNFIKDDITPFFPFISVYPLWKVSKQAGSGSHLCYTSYKAGQKKCNNNVTEQALRRVNSSVLKTGRHRCHRADTGDSVHKCLLGENLTK